MPPSPRATFRAPLPPAAAPVGAMACLLPSTLSLIASPATLISTLWSYTTFAMRPHSWSDFHLLYFPLPCQEVPQLYFCPPQSLLSCYRDFPHSFTPHPWHAFWHASVHARQGSDITDLFLFPHQRCCIYWCLLISIFAAYFFCPLLQLYISAVLS